MAPPISLSVPFFWSLYAYALDASEGPYKLQVTTHETLIITDPKTDLGLRRTLICKIGPSCYLIGGQYAVTYPKGGGHGGHGPFLSALWGPIRPRNIFVKHWIKRLLGRQIYIKDSFMCPWLLEGPLMTQWALQ